MVESEQDREDELARKNLKPALGLTIGAVILALLNIFGMGQDLCKSWLACLALSDKIYSDPAHGVAVHLATSLPRAILLSQSPANHGAIKPFIYGLAGLLLLAGLAAAARLARDRAVDKKDGLILVFALGGLALPVVVPHLFVYDLGALVPAALLLFSEGKNRQMKMIVCLFIAAIDIYCLLLVIDKALAQPLILVAIMLFTYLAAVKCLTFTIVGKKQ